MTQQAKNNINYMIYEYERIYTFKNEQVKKTFLTVIEKALKELYTFKISPTTYNIILDITKKVINKQPAKTFCENIKTFFEDFATIKKCDEINWSISNLKIA